MSEFGSVSAPLLAAVFAWAGLAKARRRAATAASFSALGLPAARGLALAVPAAELGIAAALLARPALGATAALLTLAAFSAVLGSALRRGAAVACGCFGTAGARRVSDVDLFRNAALALLAAPALAVWQPSAPTLPALIAVTGAAAAAGVALALLQLRRDTGRLWDNRLAPGPEALL